jgi:aspartate 1-decarboxylase
MILTMLKSKIHRATVTNADLNYEGSVSICPNLIEQANLKIFEQVDIYNCNTGARFHTYVIKGQPGEICLNGAAARHVQKGDLVIIACYAGFSDDEAKTHEPTCVFVDAKNQVKDIRNHG